MSFGLVTAMSCIVRIAFLIAFTVFLRTASAEESAAAKSKPTAYSKWKENDPHGKDIENAYAEKFTIVEHGDAKGFTKSVMREYANPRPVLSESGQELKGRVIICVIVRSDGRVIEPFIFESTDKRLNMPALDAARQVRFEPARLNGSPISEVGFLIFGEPLATIFAPKPTYPLGPGPLGPRPQGNGVVLLEVEATGRGHLR